MLIQKSRLYILHNVFTIVLHRVEQLPINTRRPVKQTDRKKGIAYAFVKIKRDRERERKARENNVESDFGNNTNENSPDALLHSRFHYLLTKQGNA